MNEIIQFKQIKLNNQIGQIKRIKLAIKKKY